MKELRAKTKQLEDHYQTGVERTLVRNTQATLSFVWLPTFCEDG